MTLDKVGTPLTFLQQMLPELAVEPDMKQLQQWWEKKGKAVSAATDGAGTPWLRMFDRFGDRTDDILLAPEYREMLMHGYKAGVIWRAFEENALTASYLRGYLTAFYDPGLYCPYTVSLATAVPLEKYGTAELKERFLPQILKKDETVWQGATWMTEAGGGSDLGANVETLARPRNGKWLLTGEKYFASNVGAELAVVAARPEGAPDGVRGLALFLLPRHSTDGTLNYEIRRLKDKIATRSVPTGEVVLKQSEAWLLGRPEWGIYLILEVLNISRVANSVASVALAQRALAEAGHFAGKRRAFGKTILEQPLLKKQFADRLAGLADAFALAWEAVRLLDEVRDQTPPYSERYHLFRLVAHLAKYWTAEFAAQSAKWSMEVHGGMGVLGEYPVERWLREAMILSIWEGTPHRQILDGVEVMERQGGHRLLFEHLEALVEPGDLERMKAQVDDHLALPESEREASAEEVFSNLARFAACALRQDL